MNSAMGRRARRRVAEVLLGALASISLLSVGVAAVHADPLSPEVEGPGTDLEQGEVLGDSEPVDEDGNVPESGEDGDHGNVPPDLSEEDVVEFAGPAITAFGARGASGVGECHTAAADANGAYAQTLCWFDMAGFTTKYQETSKVSEQIDDTWTTTLTYTSVLGNYGSVTVEGSGDSKDAAENDAVKELKKELYEPPVGNGPPGLYGPVTGWPIKIEISERYTLTAKLTVTAVADDKHSDPADVRGIVVSSHSFPTWGNDTSASGAYLGRKGFYTGVEGQPAIYQRVNGNYPSATPNAITVATLSEIVMTDIVENQAITDYTIVVADAETTGKHEEIEWSQVGGNGFAWLPNDPKAWKEATTAAEHKQAAVGNACGGIPADDFEISPVNPVCKGADPNDGGTAMLQIGPGSGGGAFSVTQKLTGGGRGAIAFGVIMAGAETNVNVVDRVLDSAGVRNTETVFSAKVDSTGESSSLEDSTTASGEGLMRASSGELFLPIDTTDGTEMGFESKATEAFNDSYEVAWSCYKTDPAEGEITYWPDKDTTKPFSPSSVPESADEAVKAAAAEFVALTQGGQFIRCTATWTPPYLSLEKEVVGPEKPSEWDEDDGPGAWKLTASGAGLSLAETLGDEPDKIPVTMGAYGLAETGPTPQGWKYGYQWVGLACTENNADLGPVETTVEYNDDGSVNGETASVKVQKGSDIACTYTNKAFNPKISLEKGVLEVAEGAEGAVCSPTSDDAKDPEKCVVNSYTPTIPLSVNQGQEINVIFRVTNTGEEPLLKPVLTDKTTIGDTEVKNISCAWPTKTVNEELVDHLDVDEVALCTGTLKMEGPGRIHQNIATVTAEGEISKGEVAATSQFNASTHPHVTLPNTGGRTTALFLLLAGVVGGGSAALFKRSRTLRS